MSNLRRSVAAVAVAVLQLALPGGNVCSAPAANDANAEAAHAAVTHAAPTAHGHHEAPAGGSEDSTGHTSHEGIPGCPMMTMCGLGGIHAATIAVRPFAALSPEIAEFDAQAHEIAPASPEPPPPRA